MTNTNVKSIAFLGPDGSGKSTIIERLQAHRSINYFHLKPRISSRGRPVRDPHSLKPYGRVLSFMKIVYLVIQYNLLWFKNIYLSSSENLVVFDRYFDDIICDPLRYRYSGEYSIVKWMRLCIPRPDIYFVLIGDPEIIWSRKKEVELSELKKQLVRYEILGNEKEYVTISVNDDVEVSLQTVMSHL